MLLVDDEGRSVCPGLISHGEVSALSPDGRRIVATSGESLFVYDLEACRRIEEIPTAIDHVDWRLRRVEFIGEGNEAVCLSSDLAVWLSIRGDNVHVRSEALPGRPIGRPVLQGDCLHLQVFNARNTKTERIVCRDAAPNTGAIDAATLTRKVGACVDPAWRAKSHSDAALMTFDDDRCRTSEVVDNSTGGDSR
jgi:hypothetical protein